MGAWPYVSHGGGFDGMHFGMRLQTCPADEAEAGVVVIIVGEIVHRGGLRGGSVPDVDVERKQCADAGLLMAEVMPADLAVIVRKPVRA